MCVCVTLWPLPPPLSSDPRSRPHSLLRQPLVLGPGGGASATGEVAEGAGSPPTGEEAPVWAGL